MFPLVNQLNSPTADGQPDENRDDNCGAACVAAILWYFTHTPTYPDPIKDAVYGQGYTGGEAARKYVALAHARNVELKPFDGNASQCITEMKAALDAGKPCMFTVPTRWMENVDSGSTHVMVAYSRTGEALNVMDPWGGIARTLQASYLQPRLRYNEIWEASMAIDTTGLGAGMAYFATTHNLSPVRVPEIKGLLARGRSFAVAGSSVLYWDPATAITDDQHAADVVVELYNAVHSAQTLSDQAKAAIGALSLLKQSLAAMP
jgi:hypothetical protein